MFEDDVNNLSLDSATLKPKKTRKKIKPEPTAEETAPTSFSRPRIFEEKPTPVSGQERVLFRKKRFWWGLITLIIIVGLVLGGIKVVQFSQRILGDRSPLSFFKSFGDLIGSENRPLQGEEAGQVNILLLGIGGEQHEGGLLTDTIILASIKFPKDQNSDPEIALMSIPRDFIVKIPESQEFRKINSAYAFGEIKKEGLGQVWARAVVSEWTGEDVPYYALIDFNGFEQIIDDLDGVEVEIERSFSDSFYPDNRFGYLPTLRFEQGVENMDGKCALQFARSRHGINGEGTDFARSKRQQKILLAVKNKASKLKISTSITTITNILDTISENFKTSLEPWEMKKLYELIKEIPAENILPLSLDYETGLICDEKVEETGADVLTVCPGVTKIDIQEYSQNKFAVARLRKESPSILFLNSTRVNFLAQRAADKMALEYAESETDNYPGDEPLAQTTIYDLTGGAKPLTLQYLKGELGAQIGVDYPYMSELASLLPDYIVVLGLDAPEKFPL